MFVYGLSGCGFESRCCHLDKSCKNHLVSTKLYQSFDKNADITEKRTDKEYIKQISGQSSIGLNL